jgi:acyl-CoA thioester hydrolase
MFVHREAVRFRDLDPMGHVNNAVFLTYIESARAAFLQHLGAVQTLEDLAIIVARIEIDFRAPVRFGDEVEVSVRVSRFGEKSFDLEHELRVAGNLVAEAKTVLVTYDYEKRAPVEIPAEWREKLAA